MSDRYYSSPGRQAISLRLILIIVIPLLVMMLSWLYFNRDQDSIDSVNSQPTVQTLDIPNQDDAKKQRLQGSGLENKISTDSKKENREAISESKADLLETAPKSDVDQSDAFVLPPLNESDAVFRKDVLNLSAGFSSLLNTDNIITQWLVAINDFSQNLRPYKHFRHFKLAEPFQVTFDTSGIYIAEQGYQRYNSLASAVHEVDVESALALLAKYRPLLQQAFANFDYPEQYQIEDIIKKAVSNILQAPILEGKVRVLKPTVRYKFADPKIEGLSPVQKQMIRMGPENTRIIQAKLRQFIEGLANR